MNKKQRSIIMRAIEQVPQLAALFGKRRLQLARHAGLTNAQWRILEGISSEHFMPSLFAKEECNTRGAVSKLIRQLLEKQLIKVSISQKDGRQRDYVLTGRTTHFSILVRRLLCRYVCPWRCGNGGSRITAGVACR